MAFRWNFLRREQPVGSPGHTGSTWALTTPLLDWGAGDWLTLGQACQGIQSFGATGSGKSTGSVATLLKCFLSQGFGGLFFTVKPTDRADYERYCHDMGRSDDVIVVGPNSGYGYNFLDAELQRKDVAAGLTENLASMLSAVLEVAERNSGHDGREEAGFWQRMTRQALKNSIELLVQAKGQLTVTDLYRVIITAPTSPAQAASIEWQQHSFCYQCLKEADEKELSTRQKNDYRLAVDFFLTEWPQLSDRTRPVVLSSLSSMLDSLQRGVARELLGSETNVRPEMVQDGKLIILDFPILVWGAVGQYLQIIWKYCTQKAQERRNIAENPRPVFLASDESHLLYTSTDQLFQTTARSSRTIVLNATQSISNYFAALGGDRAEAEIFSLMGNLQTQIFNQNVDVKTNTYAADLIGRTRQFFLNTNQSGGPIDWFGVATGWRDPSSQTTSAGMNETLEYEVQPSAFTHLRQGGPPDWEVDAIVVQGGKKFRSTSRPWRKVTFRQHL